MRKAIHKTKLTRYETQREFFKQLLKHIQSTISTEAAIFIAEEEAHPYNLLRALKLRYAPTDQTKKMKIEAKYRELCRGPANQDVEKWLDAWQQTYTTGKALKVYEMTEERPIRDFIYSLMDKDEAWANAHIALIDKKVEDNSLFNLISEFRNHTRMKASRKLHHSTHSAFSATGHQEGQNPSTNQNQNQSFSGGRGRGNGRGRGGGRGGWGASFRGRPQPPECLCGLIHRWPECQYLNPSIRPYNWQPDPETGRRVSEAIKNPEMKSRVENAIKKDKEIKERIEGRNNSNNHTNQPNQSKPQGGAFVTDQPTNASYFGTFTTAVAPSAFSINVYPLLSSWILDNGSDIHVCNKTMLHRFRKTRNAPPGDILAGEAKSNIEAFGEVDITIAGPGGNPWKITLKDVCYIPNFMTNIVAARKFRAKGVFFDDQKMRLHTNGKTLGWVKHVFNHDVLEDNTTSHLPQAGYPRPRASSCCTSRPGSCRGIRPCRTP